MTILNKRNLGLLPRTVHFFNQGKSVSDNQLMHIGIGGFHRSHQAFALAKLIDSNPDQYSEWRITGVGLMPNDLKLVQDFDKQDQLYALRTIAPDQSEKVYIIPVVDEMLHASTHSQEIIDKIANPHTKVISFTITEGGYQIDFEQKRFMIEQESIQHDLRYKSQPRTVFGFLAAGLSKRIDKGDHPLLLLSCDNILGNGDALRFSLLSFLEMYDSKLRSWVEEYITFPNSMVDRITPVATEADKDSFELQYGVRDNCLVVSEEFFQWVIEKPLGEENFPALETVGVQFVEHVAPYESMKLSILNAGHTLVGLLGDALGYDKIHTSVQDNRIWNLFDCFVSREVIPVLEPIDGVDYQVYFEQVRARFSNAMINDSTARIISGTSDKFPKFVLPTIQKQLLREEKQMEISALIIALWWKYLLKAMKSDGMAHVQDNLVSSWKHIFEDEKYSAERFLRFSTVFLDLADQEEFYSNYWSAVSAIKEARLEQYLDTLMF